MPGGTQATDDRSHAHDEEKNDPKAVEGVLLRELMELSVQDRNDFQEEIHGVRCLAPNETPELLNESQSMLQWELDNNIPSHQKQAYLKSQQLHDDHIQTHVNTSAFRLRFLRCEMFNAKKAAIRMCQYLDHSTRLFGDYALQRPIKIADFSKSELRYFRKGRYQFLPYRDRGGVAGRRILCIIGDEEWEAIPPYVRNKIFMYLVWVAGNDPDVQREGLIIVPWLDSAFNISQNPTIQTKDHELLTVRACAIHWCSPDTPLYRFRRSLMTMRIGKNNRSRLILHLGEGVENRYKLQSYGIYSEQNPIPITYSGKIKTIYFKQWMNAREHIEKETGQGSAIVESPYLSDIIFRKGASLTHHPGNTALRSLIVRKARLELLEAQSRTDGDHPIEVIKKVAMAKTQRFVDEVIQEMRETTIANEAKKTGKTCRFLVWDEDGWWTELSEEQEIRTRIEYIVRSIRNMVIKNHKACSTFAGATTMQTKIANLSDDTSQRQGHESVAPPPQTPTSQTKTTSAISNLNNITFDTFQTQYQEGGTSIFRYQDHSGPGSSLLRDIKKRRLALLEEKQDSNADNSECFGMKFNSTNRWTQF